jgi:hypothetical protein
MSIPKLIPHRDQESPKSFSVSVAFQHDLCDLGEAVIKTRAIQAFDSAATRYPIHRQIRCAASNRRILRAKYGTLAKAREITAGAASAFNDQRHR